MNADAGADAVNVEDSGVADASADAAAAPIDAGDWDATPCNTSCEDGRICNCHGECSTWAESDCDTCEWPEDCPVDGMMCCDSKCAIAC